MNCDTLPHTVDHAPTLLICRWITLLAKIPLVVEQKTVFQINPVWAYSRFESLANFESKSTFEHHTQSVCDTEFSDFLKKKKCILLVIENCENPIDCGLTNRLNLLNSRLIKRLFKHPYNLLDLWTRKLDYHLS